MPRSPAKLLHDVLTAGHAIEDFVSGKTLQDYANDLMLRSAVERQFEIIGEAIVRLGRLAPEMQTQLGPYHQIAFRNVIAHGYDRLDDAIVWQVIHDYLPSLLSHAEHLLPDADTSHSA